MLLHFAVCCAACDVLFHLRQRCPYKHGSQALRFSPSAPHGGPGKSPQPSRSCRARYEKGDAAARQLPTPARRASREGNRSDRRSAPPPAGAAPRAGRPRAPAARREPAPLSAGPGPGERGPRPERSRGGRLASEGPDGGQEEQSRAAHRH